MAASLWKPEGAVSHRTAAERWELDGIRAQRTVDLIVPGQRGHRVEGLRLHRCPVLPAADVTIRHRVKVRTPERTLRDLAAALTDSRTRSVASPSPQKGETRVQNQSDAAVAAELTCALPPRIFDWGPRWSSFRAPQAALYRPA